MNRESICDIIHTAGDGICPGRYERETVYDNPAYIRKLSLSDVKIILSKVDRKYWQVIDKEYQEPSMESMKAFLKVNTISEEPYVPQVHDCDNFAIELAGEISKWAKNAPFGIVFLNGHAINCFISDGVLYFVEPQSDKIYTELGDSVYINFLVL